MQPEPEHLTLEAPPSAPTLLTRRKFLYGGIIGVSGVALAGCVSGVVGRTDIEITHRTFVLPNLPPAFEGFTLTLASDIHSSPFMLKPDLSKVVALINALGSDAIVMPGDFVTSHHSEIPPFVEAMHELRAPYGIFCCTGNHDYYCGVDLVTRASEDIGFKMLRNENVTIVKDGQKLTLIGIDDNDGPQIRKYVEGQKAPAIEAAFHSVDDLSSSILLCHKPYDFEHYAKANVGLILAGHTHGGQIVLGKLGRTVFSLSTIASHFVEGIYTPTESKSRSQMYVSRGLGVVGLPIRINCPPELTRITLTRHSFA